MAPDRIENRRPLAVDLFCGAGGMSLGFEQAGFDVAVAIDKDPIHCAVHKFNFPLSETMCRDVSEVTGAEINEIAAKQGGRINVVFGGPPCQGFSMIGKRTLDDPRNRLVDEFARIVDEIRPDHFVLENVRGLTVGKHRRFLVEVVERFQSIGYSVRLPWEVLNACEYGVPQDRRRLFLIGSRTDLDLPPYPHPTHSPENVKKGAFDLPTTPTVGDALGDLPDAERYSELLSGDSAHVKYGEPSEYASRLRGLTRDSSDYSHPRRHDPNAMTSSLRTTHTETSRERFANTQPGRVEPVSRFFKLAPSGLSNTLRAGTGSERGAFTSPRPIHPEHARCITVREMARLHSYPDWFRFHATKWHGARQVGNSVPPLLARAVAQEVLRALPYEKPRRPRTIIPLGDESLLTVNMREACEMFGVPFEEMPRRTRNGRRHDRVALES